MVDIRAAVTDRYREELTVMDRIEFEEFVIVETERLRVAVENLRAATEVAVIARWRAANGGRRPETATLAALYAQAQSSAEESVLSRQLGQGRTDVEDGQHSATGRRSTATAIQRWNTEFADEATPATVELVERVWPTQSAEFQVWAEDLVQARINDGLEVPDGPEHPLTAELTQVVGDVIAGLEARVRAARTLMRGR
ncbi:hypothetical protein SAMN05445060_3807 [Williamsia sterculiae]|uniref:Uncharacterized protein n=2 Tax=Williamsia sterculiae TaxID=1344003 RepID=A0A1N7HA68_9NOCA|nr:hypothetical protein SAMN05445060_3807 [Williamsia sterculiae]